jgi:hypothetical protein
MVVLDLYHDRFNYFSSNLRMIMAIDTTIQLFMDTTDSPPYYWVEVSVSYDLEEAQYIHGGAPKFEEITNANGNYALEVYLQSCSGSQQPEQPLVRLVDLGNLASTGDLCGIEIDVMLGGQRLGGGLPKLSGAAQTSRPIPSL